MPSLLAIHAGKLPEPATIAELRAGGVMTAMRLDPLVRSLVSVITNPDLVATVEIDRPEPSELPRLATIWRRDSVAVGGCGDGDGYFELSQIDASLLPFHLAQIVRLVPRPQPRYEGDFRIPIGTLTTVESIAATDPVRAECELASAGVADTWRDRILATLIMRRSLWAVESLWLGDHRRRQAARLSVLDGGFAGYWRLHHERGFVTATPCGFDDLMRRFAALLPN